MGKFLSISSHGAWPTEHCVSISKKRQQDSEGGCECVETQVHADFENIGRAANLSTVCLYGGAPMSPQEQILRRGCDVVVGTPGRVKDHLERGNLKLQDLMCVSCPLI